jgi:DNA-binding LacI/PurR family transcriptional regulator
MAAKIEDVAREAGVSTATVSRVLSGKPYVSEDLRKRVLDAVQTLSYRPSRVARSLRVQRSNILGLIVSDVQNPFFTTVARAVEDVAYQHQFSVFLCNTDEDPEKEALYIDLMLAEHVAGVIVTPSSSTSKAYRHLVDADVPVVALDRRVEGGDIDTVVVDNVSGAYEVVAHLIAEGHRRIGAVLGTRVSTTGEERYRGYARALEAHGIPLDPALVRSGVGRTGIGYEYTQELLALANPPTALFVGNNLLTIGALRAIQEQGLRIPVDIALASFDETDWMYFVRPALTVVAQPTYELGQIAAEMLLRRLDDKHAPPREVVLRPTLLIRDSSRR